MEQKKDVKDGVEVVREPESKVELSPDNRKRKEEDENRLDPKKYARHARRSTVGPVVVLGKSLGPLNFECHTNS